MVNKCDGLWLSGTDASLWSCMLQDRFLQCVVEWEKNGEKRIWCLQGSNPPRDGGPVCALCAWSADQSVRSLQTSKKKPHKRKAENLFCHPFLKNQKSLNDLKAAICAIQMSSSKKDPGTHFAIRKSISTNRRRDSVIRYISVCCFLALHVPIIFALHLACLYLVKIDNSAALYIIQTFSLILELKYRINDVSA